METHTANPSQEGAEGNPLNSRLAARHAPTSEQFRLLYVTPRYWPYSGGVETHVHETATRMARAGVQTCIISTDPTGILPVEEQAAGVKIKRVKAWPSNRDYYFAPSLYPAILDGNWDLVHIQSYHTLVAPLAMLASWRAHIPYVVTFHGGGHSSRWRQAGRPFQRGLLRPLLLRAARLVALAPFEMKELARSLRLPESRFVIIPNGADLPEARQKAEWQRPGTVIASIGRLERYKGHHRIIAAMPEILKQQPDARLWIAGTGSFKPELERLAHSLGITDRVDIRPIPAGDRAQMSAALRGVALAVLLSEYETQPISVLEALSLQVPALVADTTGLSELGRLGWARTVPLDSTPAEVADAVLDQLRCPAVPAREALPTWDACSSALLDLYASIRGKN